MTKNKKNKKNLLFSISEQFTSSNYLTKLNEGFSYFRKRKGNEIYTNNEFSKNYIIFIISGEMIFNCGKYGKKKVKGGEFIFIPKNFEVECKLLTDCKILVSAFDNIEGHCSKLMYESLDTYIKETDYKMDPFQINKQMHQFLEMVILYQESNVKSVHIHKIKLEEMLMCFRFFYTKTELAKIFYPILGKSLEFRDILTQLTKNKKNIKEVIMALHMGKTAFYEKFKKEFGSKTPKRWFNEKITEKILYLSSKPDIRVKELAYMSGFDSTQQLQQFCKKYLKLTPTEIISKRKNLM